MNENEALIYVFALMFYLLYKYPKMFPLQVINILGISWWIIDVNAQLTTPFWVFMLSVNITLNVMHIIKNFESSKPE